MKTFMPRPLSLLLVLWTSFAFTGCFAGITGGVDTVVARADRSDPVRAAVADVLAAVEQDFTPIMGAPLSPAEREEMIRSWVSGTWLSQGQSSMDVMRMGENAAASAHHITPQIPGADSIYYQQQIVTGGVQATTQMVEFRFPVDFSQRQPVAADLIARLQPLFAVDSKWLQGGTSDPELNPVIANHFFTVYLSMGVNGSSELLTVSVDYYHDRVNHEAMKGVRILISKQDARVG